MEKVPKEDAALAVTKERRRQDLYERKRLLEKAIADLEQLVAVRARDDAPSEKGNGEPKGRE